jgi:GTP-binding protein
MRAGQAGDATDVVLADVPGLVEGAAEGKGLGHQFLRHIERCLVLVHVLDAAPFDPQRDPVGDLEVLRDELRRYRPELLDRPQVVVLNKVDLPDGQAMAELYADQLAEVVQDDPIRISALTGEGLDTLRWRLAELVNEVRGVAQEAAAEPDDAPVVLRPLRARDDVAVNRVSSGAYRVSSDRIERWVAMLPSDNREALRYLEGRLRRAGVEKALVRAGARKGDEVVIGELLFEFRPDPHQLPPDERDAALAAERAEEFGEEAEHDGIVREETAADADLDATLDDEVEAAP